MYVCMHVCIYVCIYVCTYVCIEHEFPASDPQNPKSLGRLRPFLETPVRQNPSQNERLASIGFPRCPITPNPKTSTIAILEQKAYDL